MKWLEVPMHRILVLSNEELKDYELLDADGRTLNSWSTSSFTLAMRNNHVYKKVVYRPNDHESSLHYLEEL